jgi:hypothetical protein
MKKTLQVIKINIKSVNKFFNRTMPWKYRDNSFYIKDDFTNKFGYVYDDGFFDFVVDTNEKRIYGWSEYGDYEGLPSEFLKKYNFKRINQRDVK